MTSDGDLNIAGQITRDAVEKTSELIVVALREVVPQHGAIGVQGAGTVELRARDRHGNAGWIKIVLIGDGLESGLLIECCPYDYPPRGNGRRAIVCM